MPDSKLHKFLRRIRHRLLMIGTTAGFCWGLLLAGVLLLASIWLDLLWELSASWRLATMLCAVLSGLFLLALLFARSCGAARDCHAAKRLDRATGGGGLIVSGWELERHSEFHVPSPSAALTAGLARMAVEQATRLAETIPASQAVSLQPIRKAAGTLGAFALLTAVAAVCLPALTATQLNRFLYPFSDVPPFSSVRLAVEPGDTRVIYGAGLDVHVTVTAGSVERVELMLDDGTGQLEVLPMFPETGHRWRATLTHITVPARYSVRADRARSPHYRIDVVTVPRIESVRFRVTPPAYANEPSYDGPLPRNGLAGLPGTSVSVSAKSNRPLRAGMIDVHGTAASIQIPMQPTTEGSEEVTGTLTIQAAGRFRVTVVDVAGQSSQDPFGGSITLLEDQRPFVRLLAPQQFSLATPSASLPVAVATEDDYGIARVQLFRSLNNSRPLPLEWTVERPPPRRWQAQISLPLTEFGLSPGDEIKLFARVEDNDPAGAKGAESSVATVHIISQADFERMLRQREGLGALMSKYQAAQRRMEQLRTRIAELQKQLADTDPDSGVADAMRDKLKELIQQLREQGRQIRESAEHPLPYDADQTLGKQLKQLADQLAGAAQSLESLPTQADLNSGQLAEKLEQVARQLAQDHEQFQQEAMQPLELLARVYPLLQDQSRYISLAMRQRDLSDRLAALKGRDGEDDPALKARTRELEEEQRTLRGELSDLLNDIEDHVKQLPDDNQFDALRDTATDFVEALRSSGASDAMSSAEAALAEFQGTRGYEEAVRAAQILERFIKQCNGVGANGEGCLAFQPALGNCLNNTARQLLAEMGLGTGSGSGGVSGNGYSARRGGRDNMGLYGGLPGVSSAAGGAGFGPDAFRSGAGGGLGSATGADRPSLFPADAAGGASAAGEALIPTTYRQRVGQYFLRIAEEAGND